MKRRMTLATTIVLCVLIAALAVGLAACGSGGTTTTAAPATTTTIAPTTTAAVATTTTAATTATTAAATVTTAASTDTTAAGSFTMPSIQMTPEIQAYAQQLTAWAATLQSLPDSADPLQFTDVSQVTDAQVAAGEAGVKQIRTAVDQLKAITPPAELAQFQTLLANAILSEADIAERALDAIKNKDQAAFDAAKADGDKLEEQMNGLFDSLMPLLMGGTATS
jgi:hypothetical protein